jgi:hypothetical protein
MYNDFYSASSNHFSVIPREPMVEIAFEHDQPSLIDEIYPLKLRLTNHEETTVSNVK